MSVFIFSFGDRFILGILFLFGGYLVPLFDLGFVWILACEVMSSKRIIPLLNRVLVQRMEAQKKTAGGLFLPGQKDSREAVVLAVGPGALDSDGKAIPMTLKEGDKILLPDYGGTELTDSENVKLILFREDDILAKVE